MTLHKAQGRTVHTALVVGSAGLSAQAGYVGLSRGTHANHLFLTTRDLYDLTTDCGHAAQHRPIGRASFGSSPLLPDVRQRLASEATGRGRITPSAPHLSDPISRGAER